jgi:pimeloyl-ACP methyl ester carboxylesterase
MMDNARALMSDDAAVYEQGARAFLAACPVSSVPAPFVEDALAWMLRVPVGVRRALLSRNEDFRAEIEALRVPFGIVHGAEDRVVLPSVGRDAARASPDARFVEMAGVGHLPWVEAEAAFEEEMRALVERARPGAV